MDTYILTACKATIKNTSEYGLYIGEEVGEKRLSIPFYSHVHEGANLPFEYTGRAVIRSAQIFHTNQPFIWLERHVRMTQFFIGIGQFNFALILGKPNHEKLPNINDLRCFIFNSGTGILLHKGTWHDFPIATQESVTVLTGNSNEVIDTLIKLDRAREIDEGDIFKLNIADRLGIQIKVEFS